MIFFYTLSVCLLFPLLFLGFVWRYGLRRTLAGLPERWGRGPGPRGPEGVLWVHAASVGEVRAVEGFMKAAAAKFPGLPRLLTTTTVNGKELAERGGLADHVRLAPVDLPIVAGHFLKIWQPKILVLVETELWPHWLRSAAQKKIPVAVVNGRISDGTFRTYLALERFWAPLLGSLSRVGVQSPAQASRFLQLGARPEAVAITGNLKYDVPLPDPSRGPALRLHYGFEEASPVLAAGSTHSGEDAQVLDAFLAARLKHRALKMILAPRHTERALEAAALAEKRGLKARLRSRLSMDRGSFDVLILDTVGELADLYGAASVAFVGGSLAAKGGQNPLEPARWGLPVLFGPHMENFREMTAKFLERKAALRVTADTLAGALAGLLSDDAARRNMGAAARDVADGERGALAANLALVAEALSAPAPAAEVHC